MSQTDAERRVTAALSETGSLTPEGSARVQINRGTTYLALPVRLRDHYDIAQGDSLKRAYDPDTGCLLIFLGDYDLFE